ncbi:hypothetical protein SAMN04489860_1063 [Paraoerskovia marina]|uniref:Uncharacterized protein n=1 Tax=Paraoerskovia marina TaxID=545619 RepID=A0A1H1QEI2_9CELL|nr:hypothetical protein SAMN04489860_1063 [Paraoerskovia marina]
MADWGIVDHRLALKAPFVQTAGALVAVALTLGGCTQDDASTDATTTAEPVAAQETAVAAALPDAATLSSDAPAELALMASQQLFESAPTVVLVGAEDDDALELVGAVATEVAGPVLVLDGAIGSSAVRTELERLGARTAVVVGAVDPAEVVDGSAGEVEVISVRATDAAGVPTGVAEVARLLSEVPDTGEPTLADESLVLTDPEDDVDHRAALATARAAGAVPLDVPGGDPRASDETIGVLRQAQALSVVALGDSFADSDDLAEQVRAASTGVELPGGGMVLTDGRRFVGLYGTRISPSLGALGQQDTDASIERARRVAESTVPGADDVVPTLELLVTVASPAPGADGNHANEQDPQAVLEFAERARKAGQYVVLAVQPGSATFVEQLRAYDDALALPNVGVSLETEWRFVDSSSPALSGTIPTGEVSDVVDHLRDVVRTGALPQKLLVIRDSAPSAVVDPAQLPDATEVGVVIAGPAGREPDLEEWGAETGVEPMWGATRWLQGADVPAAELGDEEQPTYVVYR